MLRAVRRSERKDIGDRSEDLGEEGLGALVLRVVEDLRGRALLDDRPPSMKTTVSATSRAKPISCVTTISVVPLAGEVLDDVEDLADQLGVERRGGLVEEQHFGSQGERAGDGDALLLAAGELPRVGVGLVREPDPLEQRLAPRRRPPRGCGAARRPAPR